MRSNDVREGFLECSMTSDDVREECYIRVMMGRCVNKPDQREPGGCYENTFISKFEKCVKVKLLFHIFALQQAKKKIN